MLFSDSSLDSVGCFAYWLACSVCSACLLARSLACSLALAFAFASSRSEGPGCVVALAPFLCGEMMGRGWKGFSTSCAPGGEGAGAGREREW